VRRIDQGGDRVSEGSREELDIEKTFACNQDKGDGRVSIARGGTSLPEKREEDGSQKKEATFPDHRGTVAMNLSL